jgi:hypothetical protein
LATRAAPIVHHVLADLKQPIDGPTARNVDLDERSTPRAAAPARLTRPPPQRRSVTIRESTARAVMRLSPILGETLDERVDHLLARQLVELGAPVWKKRP